MKTTPSLLLIIILGLALIPIVSADSTLTFRDSSLVGYQSFNIYQVDETGTHLLGLYNSSTEALILDTGTNSSGAYILQYIPTSTDFWSDPVMGLDSLTNYATTHYGAWLVILFLMLMAALAVALSRRG